MIKIGICDDEKEYLEKIGKLVTNIMKQKQINDYEIQFYSSGKQLSEDKKSIEKFDIIFLDINMKEMNGIETAKKIREINGKVYIVFITAYADYAIEGYQVEAVRFVLKDVLEEMLKESIDTIIRKMQIENRKIKYHFVEGEREISIEKIRYIENQQHRQIFHIDGKSRQEFHMYGKLDDIEKDLCSYGFIRIHKSFLINVYKISTMKNYKVSLVTGETFSVPRGRYKEIKEEYFRMLGEV